MSTLRQICRHSFLACGVLIACILPGLANAAIAGKFQFVVGKVTVIDSHGKQRPAQKGADIEEGETLVTDENGSAQIRMIDDGILALRPDTQLKISIYRYQGKEDGSENALFSLLRGGLRAITGAIGKANKENYKLQTPNATIGIRGTDHEAVVVLPQQANASTGLQAGTYDKVNVGGTSLTTKAGVAIVGPNQVGFAASLNQAPVVLPKMPDIFRAAPPPAAKSAQNAAKSTTQTATTTDSSTNTSSTAGTETSTSTAGTTSASTSSATSATTTASATTTEPTVTNLTGVNSAGTSLNTLNQTVTTSSGSTAPITTTMVRAVGTSGNWMDGNYLYSSLSPSDPNAFRGSVDGGVQAPSQVIEDGTGLIGFNGKASGFTPLSGSTTSVAAGATTTNNTLAAIRIGTASNQEVNTGSVAGVPVTWGRWVGGVVNIYTPDGSSQIGTVDNTNRSIHWITIGSVPSNFLQVPVTGTASYTVLGHTSPTDLIGNVGTLTNASLNVDFTNARASTTIGVNFASPTNSSTWSMTANNVPISTSVEEGFKSNTALNGTNGITHTVSCTGPSCGAQNVGAVNGHLVLNAQGAVVIYTMGSGKLSTVPQSSAPAFTPSSVVNGLVVLTK